MNSPDRASLPRPNQQYSRGLASLSFVVHLHDDGRQSVTDSSRKSKLEHRERLWDPKVLPTQSSPIETSLVSLQEKRILHQGLDDVRRRHPHDGNDWNHYHYHHHHGVETTTTTRRSLLRSITRNTAFLGLSSLLATTTQPPETMFLALAATLPSQGGEGGGGMKCVASKCSKELTMCLSDQSCAKGLRCLVGCTGNLNNDDEEGGCQVHCMDLYQTEKLDAFTECTLTNHHCYPALSPDERYPPLPHSLWEEAPHGGSTGVRNGALADSEFQYLSNLFRGRWYVSAGLNPMFDAFDCAEHDFYEPFSLLQGEDKDKDKGQPSSSERMGELVVADASFHYRIPTEDGKFFTRVGNKRLTLVEDESGRRLLTNHNNNKVPLFETKKKWGIDQFRFSSLSSMMAPMKYNRQPQQPQYGRKLQLALLPNSMDYADEWTVLSSSDDPEYGFIVLAYRGKNAAWEGYGGLNVYTRVRRDFKKATTTTTATTSSKERDMLDGIKRGLRKVELDLDDLIQVNNQPC